MHEVEFKEMNMINGFAVTIDAVIAEPVKKSVHAKRRKFTFAQPEDIDIQSLHTLSLLVMLGGQVSEIGYMTNLLKRAELIAYVEQEDLISAVSVMKNPNKSYKDKLKELTGITLPSYELGYSYVLPNLRGQGINTYLTTQLVSLFDGVYATTHKDNAVENKTLEKVGFVMKKEFKKDNKDLYLWLK